MVVASYVLGEARSPSERRRLVDSLWRRTDGLLVLVEPGTPVGSANVREARAQVLPCYTKLAIEGRALGSNQGFGCISGDCVILKLVHPY